MGDFPGGSELSSASVWYLPVYLENFSFGSGVLLYHLASDRGLLNQGIENIGIVDGEVQNGFEEAGFVFAFGVVRVEAVTCEFFDWDDGAIAIGEIHRP